MAAQNYVLRSVYLPPEFDNYLREEAFSKNVSKNDLIRKLLELGAKADLEQTLSHLTRDSSIGQTSGKMKAARQAHLLPAAGVLGPTKGNTVKTSAKRSFRKSPAAKKVATKKVAAKKAASKKAT